MLLGEHRRGIPQTAGHSLPLAALAGEDEGDAPLASGETLDHALLRLAGRERAESRDQLVGIIGEHRGAMRELGAAERQCRRRRFELELGPALQVGRRGCSAWARSARSLEPETRKGRDGASSTPPSRARTMVVAPSRAGTGASSRIMCAFVPEIPNDETRGPPSALAGRPAHRLAEELHLAVAPLDIWGWLLRIERPRQRLVSERHDHLDHAGHSRCRLRVADVALHRAEPDRPVGPVAPIGLDQRLRLDRVAELGTGPVSLDSVDDRPARARHSPGPGG